MNDSIIVHYEDVIYLLYNNIDPEKIVYFHNTSELSQNI